MVMTVNYELTDTFNGEPNYAWVRRQYDDVKPTIKDRELIRRAKAWAGWTGMQCDIDSYDGSITIRPRATGIHQILFVNIDGA
jgi:hypothetical protein